MAGVDHETLDVFAQQRAAVARVGRRAFGDERADAGPDVEQAVGRSASPTTLWAVFGLMRSSRLSTRTDGNSSPGRSRPDTIAFFTAKTTCS